MDIVILFLFIILIIILPWLLSPPTPRQLCKMIYETIAEDGDIDELAADLRKYLFDDEYCKQHRETLGKLFDVLSKNRDLAEAVFGNFAAIYQRQTEIERLPPPDDTGCGCSCSGHAR